MKKRLFSLFLCLVMTLGLCSVSALAAPARNFSLEESLAADLKTLGLFNGVSETDFDLDGELNRVGAVVMLVRMLGEEQTAKEAALPHPFTDVPTWAGAHMGYALEHGLANGRGTHEFGTDRADAATYLTLILRALGYSDAPGGDFVWNDPFPLAMEVNILPEQVDVVNFLRADVVLISYAALGARLKDSQQTLAEKLMDAGVFTREEFYSCYNTSLYPDFVSVPDFGPFAELEPTNTFANLLGMTYEYDLTSLIDENGDDTLCTQVITAYQKLLLVSGFVRAEDTETGEVVYFNERTGEMLYLDNNQTDHILWVAPMVLPVTYEAHPDLIDFGWYSGLSQYAQPDDDGEFTLYSYYWEGQYAAEEMDTVLNDYFNLMVMMGGYEYLGFREDAGYTFMKGDILVFVTPYEGNFLFVSAFY